MDGYGFQQTADFKDGNGDRWLQFCEAYFEENLKEGYGIIYQLKKDNREIYSISYGRWIKDKMYDLWTTEVFDNTVKIKESSRIFIDDECKGLGSEKFYSKKEQLVEEY